MDDEKPRYHPYNQPAGGWGAAVATTRALMKQSVLAKGSRALLSMNQPGGFKCPSCAFPDPCHRQTLEFCEQGAKALAFEATKLRVTRDFFAEHTVSALRQQSDYWLEMQGRLTEPMRYDASTDKYVPTSWDDAFALIGRHLRGLDDPHKAEFYTSGRTPNEVAFLWSVFVREFGTNNFRTVRTCATSRQAVGCRRPSGSARAPASWTISRRRKPFSSSGRIPAAIRPG